MIPASFKVRLNVIFKMISLVGVMGMFINNEAETNFSDDIFKCILLNEDIWISVNISLKFVPMGQINNIPLFRKMACQLVCEMSVFASVLMR